MKKILSIIPFLLMSSCIQNERNPGSTLKMTTSKELKINNQNEYDQLVEVVVGRWVPGTFELGDVNSDLKDFVPYITDEGWDYITKLANKKLTDVFPEDDKDFYEEQENLVKTFEDLGIKVRRPDPNPFASLIASQCYARDPIVTIGNKVILTNLRAEQRRVDSGSYNRIAQDLVENYEGKVVRMPALNQGFPETNIYLEGGDVFVEGKNVYVGLSGNGSNKKGIEWLENELGDEYTVHTIPLIKADVLHLDCAMMIINENLGIISKGDFVDFDALPESLKNRDWIEVEKKDAQRMGTNGVVINRETVIIIDAFPHIAQKIREKGITVIEVPFKKGKLFSGGLRCSYQPIRRK